MSHLLELIAVFFKISVFSFGGGYVIVGSLQNEIVSRGWITASDFMNIVSISQMTPGPIGINAATFVGFTTAGYIGAIAATFAVILLPFIIILLISIFYEKYKSSKIVGSILSGIRPACAGIVFVVGVKFFETAVMNGGKFLDLISGSGAIDIRSVILFFVTLAVMLFTKVKPIYLMLLSMVVGIFLF